jgi:hypothetical protein
MKALFFHVLMLVTFATFAQDEKPFPILFWDDHMQWNAYDSIKNARLDGLSLTFDLNGITYTSKAYPYIRTYNKAAPSLPGNKADSVIYCKLFLFPCTVPTYDDKVIRVQVNYFYKPNSREVDGYGVIPLALFRTLDEARR